MLTKENLSLKNKKELINLIILINEYLEINQEYNELQEIEKLAERLAVEQLNDEFDKIIVNNELTDFENVELKNTIDALYCNEEKYQKEIKRFYEIRQKILKNVFHINVDKESTIDYKHVDAMRKLSKEIFDILTSLTNKESDFEFILYNSVRRLEYFKDVLNYTKDVPFVALHIKTLNVMVNGNCYTLLIPENFSDKIINDTIRKHLEVNSLLFNLNIDDLMQDVTINIKPF